MGTNTRTYCKLPYPFPGVPAQSWCGSVGPPCSWRRSCGNTATRGTRTRPHSRQGRALRRPPLEVGVRPRSAGRQRPPLQETKTSPLNARHSHTVTELWSRWIKRRPTSQRGAKTNLSRGGHRIKTLTLFHKSVYLVMDVNRRGVCIFTLVLLAGSINTGTGRDCWVGLTC